MVPEISRPRAGTEPVGRGLTACSADVQGRRLAQGGHVLALEPTSGERRRQIEGQAVDTPAPREQVEAEAAACGCSAGAGTQGVGGPCLALQGHREVEAARPQEAGDHPSLGHPRPVEKGDEGGGHRRPHPARDTA